jgi:hypothetical protein
MAKLARIVGSARDRGAVAVRNGQGFIGALLVAVGVGYEVGPGWGAVVFGGFVLLGAAVS